MLLPTTEIKEKTGISMVMELNLGWRVLLPTIRITENMWISKVLVLGVVGAFARDRNQRSYRDSIVQEWCWDGRWRVPLSTTRFKENIGLSITWEWCWRLHPPPQSKET